MNTTDPRPAPVPPNQEPVEHPRPELVLRWAMERACIPAAHIGGDRWHTLCGEYGQEYDIETLRRWCEPCPACLAEGNR